MIMIRDVAPNVTKEDVSVSYVMMCLHEVILTVLQGLLAHVAMVA